MHNKTKQSLTSLELLSDIIWGVRVDVNNDLKFL